MLFSVCVVYKVLSLLGNSSILQSKQNNALNLVSSPYGSMISYDIVFMNHRFIGFLSFHCH